VAKVKRSAREIAERRRARRQARREERDRVEDDVRALPSSDYAGPVNLLYYGSQSRVGALTREQWTAAGVTGFLLRLDPCHPEYGKVGRIKEFVARAADALPAGGELHVALQAETHGMVRGNAWGLFPEWSDSGAWGTYLAHIDAIARIGREYGARSMIWNVEREASPGDPANWQPHPQIAMRAEQLVACAGHHGLPSGIAGSLILEGRREGCRDFARPILDSGAGGTWWAEDGYTYASWRWDGQLASVRAISPRGQHVGAISLDYGKLGAAGVEAQRAAIRSAAEAQAQNKVWIFCQNGWPADWTLR